MRALEDGNGAPPQRPATEKKSSRHQAADRPQDSVPYVWATAYPPAGRRHHWLLVILSCPACRGAHAHRGGADGGLRRAGCGSGSYYVKPRPALGAAA